MGWRLAPDVTFCVASKRAIFLDVAADRYMCLPERLNTPFVRWVLGDHAVEYHSAAAMLERTGLLVPIEGDAAPAPCRITAVRSSLSPLRPGPAAALLMLVRFRCALNRVRRRLTRWGLSGALAHVSAQRAAAYLQRDPRAIAAPLLPVGAALGTGDDCLARSLALVDCLHLVGSDGTVVLGVLAMPFGAHCWVQVGDCVLNDHVDRVSLFTPILAL